MYINFALYVILALILSMLTYARFTKLDNEVRNRTIELDRKEDHTKRKIQGLQYDCQQLKERILDTQERIAETKRLRDKLMGGS